MQATLFMLSTGLPRSGKKKGKLKRNWKVREKSRNLKVNSYAGSLQKFVQKGSRGLRIYFLMRKSKPISLLMGAILIGKNLLPCGVWQP